MPLLLRAYARPDGSAVVGAPEEFEAELSISRDGLTFEKVLQVQFDATDDTWQFREGVFHPHPWQVSKRARVELKAAGSAGTVKWAAVGLYNDPSVTCDCNDGFYLNLDTPNCRTCSPQPSCRSSLAECYRCPAGSACKAGVMLKCGNGQFSWGGSLECQSCESGWICEDGLTLPCASDGSIEVNGVCTACPAGHNCRNGVKYQCPAGKYSEGGGSRKGKQCLNCEPGRYAAGAGAASCDQCDAGKSSGHGHDACVECGEGETTSGPGRFPCVSL